MSELIARLPRGPPPVAPVVFSRGNRLSVSVATGTVAVGGASVGHNGEVKPGRTRDVPLRPRIRDHLPSVFWDSDVLVRVLICLFLRSLFLHRADSRTHVAPRASVPVWPLCSALLPLVPRRSDPAAQT